MNRAKEWWYLNWPLVVFGAAFVLCFAALSEIADGRRACYAKGYEFEAAYFSGETICVETTNATRRVITIQR